MLNRFDENNDIILSVDSVYTPMWSTGNGIIPDAYEALVSEVINNFYINAHVDNITNPIEFSISYCNETGANSAEISDGTNASEINYLRYKNLILGDVLENFTFGDTNVTEFFVINLPRTNYKEKIRLNSLSLNLRDVLIIKDNSVSSPTFISTSAGRAYNLTDGDGNFSAGKSYGWLLPDVGLILLDVTLSGVTLNYPTTRPEITLFNAITDFTLTAEESVASIYAFVRAKNGEFNYTENPSFVDENGEVILSQFINNPQTYITTVGFYNDDNELLAVAKLSQPLPKNFTKEALIRAKLTY